MKTAQKIIFVMVMVILILPVIGMAEAGKKGHSPQQADEQESEKGRFELTNEKIENFMARLKETDPEKAKELEELRNKDPEAFKAELRKTMRERWHEKRGEIDRRDERGDSDKIKGKCPEKGFESYGRFCEHMRWMKERHPKELERMVELSQHEPELFRQRMQHHLDRYGKIAETEESNPELAKALEEDLKLKDQRDKLLRQIRHATEDKKKQELTTQLKDVVSKRFDLIVKRKQMEYEQLRKRLERLEKQVDRRESEIKKWQNVKDEEVKKHVEELLEQTEEFNWD